MSVDLEAEVQALRNEVKELKHQVVVDFTNHILAQQKQISSRKGDPGRDSVVPGPAGRDAVLIVKQDNKENVVRIYDESGSEKATLIAVPGPAGRDGVSPPPAKDGRNGVDGKSSPSLSEIVGAVLAELKRRWIN